MIKMEERHGFWLRFFHWINMVSITLLIFSGLCIHAPDSIKLFGNMDNTRMLHFAMGYVLLFGVIGRVYYAIVAKDAKNVLFNPIPDIKNLPSMMKYYMFLSDSHPDYGKYNPGQKMMYTGWLLMAILMLISGFILYAPNSFMGLAGILGGLLAVRLIHYIITWLFILSILAHVYLDLSEGIPVLLSMFTGKIPKDFHGQTHDKNMEA
ncbi:MAG: Ni/Fe-hydrogenase, b-type cytochrome subunit [Syntrophomonadaceae bacterium]|nr:Ni/Fe-hydrogenase, b-type cytochrome subunit [Syntrophomonadaceae bacterium]